MAVVLSVSALSKIQRPDLTIQLHSTAGEAIRAVVLSASPVPKIQRPDLTIQYTTLRYTITQDRQYNAALTSLSIQYRGSIGRCWAGGEALGTL